MLAGCCDTHCNNVYVGSTGVSYSERGARVKRWKIVRSVVNVFGLINGQLLR